MFSSLLSLMLLCGLPVFAQSPLQLGYIPLAVKTPYLHGWVASRNGSTQPPAHIWPNFFTTDRILGWCGMIRVDNQVYQWLGDGVGFDFNFTNTLANEITPTKSVFRLQAGPIQFNATFLSPVETTDYVRQSMPFSYMSVDEISASDSQTHNIQVYSDISAEWVSRDDNAIIDGNTTDHDNVVYHYLQRENPLSMEDDQNMVEDSVGYYGMARRPNLNLTWRRGIDNDTREMFATRGGLDNSRDFDSRAVNKSWPVFALSVDLGPVSPGSQPDPVVIALGIVRDPLVTYKTEPSVQTRTSYYWSKYSDIDTVISDFLTDFPSARNRSSALDDKVMSAASAVSPEYAGILSLVTRQIFAAMDVTVPSGTKGSLDTSDVKIFMKDIGVSLRANPVEVIYGAFPALLYLNASSFARDLLVPLLDFQSSSLYKNPYASPDLGTGYPNITGNTNDNDTFAVESCGNMLIMAYAYAVKSGDGSLLSQYYIKLRSWADFLVHDLTTTGGLNNTGGMSNAAIKGILGIYSMAMINKAVNFSDTYMTHAMQLIAGWNQSSVTDTHINAVYNQSNSWGLMYNLFPAIWLNTGLVQDSTLNLQAEFYANQTGKNFGFSLDTSQDVAYPHWTTMTAATIPGNLPAVRDQLIKPVYQQAYTATNVFPLPVKYDPSTGDHLSGSASGSAIQGAAFGILALSLPNVDINAGPVNLSGSGKAKLGAILGGVIGGLALLLVLLGGLFFWHKRRQKQDINTSTEDLSRPYPFNVFQWNDWNRILHPREHNPSVAATTTKSSRADPPADTSPAPTAMMSRKQRDAGPRPVQTNNPTTSAPATSASGTEDLRAEMEELRREMDSIRQIAEPPPGYD
ncbi:hypothetical protein P691DRAFT_736930 [Macrolepiota fuliginosa MF-IS2]|uniref:DUF1793-domain-containing protein n=1 Tax=Macrolepiota fuliginosa MF-IS2 TaxID=1400762 RepID=A0A9P6C022_9AGAR|nr:hypothetical protein P691DRAFT_736930 [Macrolepiota fuliginosa MF-IS2]